MSAFAVILNKPDAQVVARLKEVYPYPDHLELSPDAYLVSGNLPIEDVAAKLGFKGEDAIEDAVGVVLSLSGTYGGRTFRSVWDWLARAGEQA